MSDEGLIRWDVVYSRDEMAKAYNRLRAMYDGAEARATAAERERDALREAAQMIADDYQSSPKHHPNDILIPVASFHRLLAALTANHSAPVVEE